MINSEHKPNGCTSAGILPMQCCVHVPLLVSFSGGRTSAFMAKYLKERYADRQMLFVFANTGKEREETLQFINECDKRWSLNVIWLEYCVVDDKSTFKIVDFENASRNGEPFEAMIKKYGLPNKAFPHCTRELKERTIKRYMRSIGFTVWETAIGIRIDEAHRINWQTAKEQKKVYPLATEIRATKDFIRQWWDKQDFDLQLKDYEGNCDMCWKKSERKLMTLILEKPELLEWWNEMEIKYGADEFTFFRNNKSAIDLLELAKQPFRKAKDEHEINQMQVSMFEDIDVEYDCFCKST